jgi:hypothetical protein
MQRGGACAGGRGVEGDYGAVVEADTLAEGCSRRLCGYGGADQGQKEREDDGKDGGQMHCRGVSWSEHKPRDDFKLLRERSSRPHRSRGLFDIASRDQYG